MPAYHSSFLEEKSKNVAGFAILPFTSRPSIICENGDIIDEAITLFRPNAYFRTFEIKGPADRTLAYLLLFIGDCLSKLKTGQAKIEAHKQLSLRASSGFPIPGESSFPSNLRSMFSEAAASKEAEELREYLGKIRVEALQRLLNVVYETDSNQPSQWWMSFQKRKFMGKSLA